MVNAAGVNVPPNMVVVPDFSVPSKIDCCAACAQVFNCVWWKFDFGSSAQDPWAPGMCHYAYHTDNTLLPNGSINNVPAICPNGLKDGTLLSITPAYDESGLYKTGYNAGQCASAGAYEIAQSDQDFGCPASDPSCSNSCPGSG
jgi:hypothetical protein